MTDANSGAPRADPRDIAVKGSHIYQNRYRSDFERRYLGQFAAINIETEDAYVADAPEDALKKARAASPAGIFFLVRVGSRGAFKVSRMSYAHPRII
jgi:hypothetical protein